jgi:hypothetical protein
MIGDDRIQRTREFTIVKVGKPDPGYEVELDGVTLFYETSLDESHKAIKAAARANGYAGAGVTEAFGRNRQFIITPRYGFKRYTL